MPSLPQLEDVPECTDDKMLYETICDIFKKYRQENEPSISDFEDEILWLFNVIDNRSSNKLQTLFECGFIFLQDKIGVNVSQIAATISLTNIQINQRIKNWVTNFWDIQAKKMLISHFCVCDLRSWSLKKIVKSDRIRDFINSKISLQASYPVSEVNTIPPPLALPVTTINVKIFDGRRIESSVIFSEPPKEWKFNHEPKRSFVLS